VLGEGVDDEPVTREGAEAEVLGCALLARRWQAMLARTGAGGEGLPGALGLPVYDTGV
jgi:hypothetical protein